MLFLDQEQQALFPLGPFLWFLRRKKVGHQCPVLSGQRRHVILPVRTSLMPFTSDPTSEFTTQISTQFSLPILMFFLNCCSDSMLGLCNTLFQNCRHMVLIFQQLYKRSQSDRKCQGLLLQWTTIILDISHKHSIDLLDLTSSLPPLWTSQDWLVNGIKKNRKICLSQPVMMYVTEGSWYFFTDPVLWKYWHITAAGYLQVTSHLPL